MKTCNLSPQMTYVLLDIAVQELFPEITKVNEWEEENVKKEHRHVQ